jgi:hypothetical protein
LKVWLCGGSVEELNIALQHIEDEGFTLVGREYLHGEAGTIVHLWVDEKSPEVRASIEKVELQRCVEIARKVQGDGNFFTCKNAEQRSMYLLHHYNVAGRDAAKVVELLKPEMASLLGA